MHPSPLSQARHLASPPELWSGLLHRAEPALLTAKLLPRREARDAASSTAARAHTRLLMALAARSHSPETLITELMDDTIAVLASASSLTPGDGDPAQVRTVLLDRLRQRLATHEDRVLAGERTYAFTSDEDQEPATRIRRAISARAAGGPVSAGELGSLRTAAVELASLLVRAAANVASSGTASTAAEPRTARVDDIVRASADHLARRAYGVDRAHLRGADLVAHHLAAGLRVRAPTRAFLQLTLPGSSPAAKREALARIRDAWLQLATAQFSVVEALDGPGEGVRHPYFAATFQAAIVECAARTIGDAQLSRRPSAYRHADAWYHHGPALSQALHAHIAQRRVARHGAGRAHLLTFNRLIQAVVAIATIDLQDAGSE